MASAAVTLRRILDQDRSLVVTKSTERQLVASSSVLNASLVVTVAGQRVAALGVEVVQLIRSAEGRGSLLGRTSSRNRDNLAVTVVRWTQIHLALHLVNVLLRVIDHLNGFLPFFLECRLCLLNVLLLHLDPSVNLLLLRLEGPRRELVLLEELLDVPPLFLFLELEDFLFELDQFGLLRVLHDHFELLLRVLLEGIPVEEAVAGLAGAVLLAIVEPVHGACVPLNAARLDTGLVLTEFKLAV